MEPYDRSGRVSKTYWKTEILDAYCRILLLAKQIGQPMYLSESKSRELLDLKKKWGFEDPRFHNENCDLCGNSAFRDGYKENIPVQKAFEPAPEYPGYLQKPCGAPCESKPADVNEDLVKMITSQVLAALGKA